MSNYGTPPSDQPAQPGPDPYGQPAQGGYGQDPYAQQQNPYGGDSYGQPVSGGVPQGVTFAHWGKRVGATLIDSLIAVVVFIPYFIGAGMAAGGSEVDPVTGELTTNGFTGMAVILMLLSVVLSLAYFVWNYCLKQGKTGYTIGKGVLGIKLVKAETGQPVGPGMAFVRQLAHILDSLPCYLGYLWPLWDAQRQTFADKVMSTYVIDQPKS